MLRERWLSWHASAKIMLIVILVSALAIGSCGYAFADETGDISGDAGQAEVIVTEEDQDAEDTSEVLPEGGILRGASGDETEDPEGEIRDIETCDVFLSEFRFAYTGSEIIPDVIVSLGEEVLEAGRDYELEYVNNVGPGKAYVIVNGIGSYTGKKTVGFVIFMTGWIKEGDDWYYYNENGDMVYDGWAKEGSEDRFWTESAAGTPVLAFGLGAVTAIDGAVSRNTTDLERYLNYSADYEAITETVNPI